MADERQPNILFTAGAGNTAAIFAQVKGELAGLGSAVSQARALMLSLAGALGVGSFGAGIKAASEAADAAAKMGDRFGIATEKMIGMQHAGDLAGVSNEGLTAAFKGLAKSSVDAARGGEEAGRAYSLLNINAGEFVKLPMDRQLSIVIDKLGQVENVSLRNALAQQLMGKNAGEMMGLVAEGSEAFQKAAADAEAWGLAINRVDAAKLEMANDSIKRAEAAAKGLFTQIALAVAPGVKTLMDYFADSSAEARGFRDQVTNGSEVAIQAIGQLSNFIQGLRFAWVAAKLGVAEFADFTIAGISKILNIIPNAWGDNLKLMSESMAQTTADIKAELDALADEGLPADKIIARIREVTAAMEAGAQEIAKRRQDMMRGSPEDLAQDKGTDTFTAGLVRQLEQIAEANKTELEMLQFKHERKQEALEISLERGYITQEFWEAQTALVFSKYEAEKTRIIDEETKKRFGISNVYRQLDLASAQSFFGALAGMMQSKNRAMWEVGKAAAVSETIIQTYRAAQGAYASLASIPYVGPALGAAAAAAAIVVGLARVQAIRSTQFGSSSASPVFNANPSTGVPTSPISPVQASPGGQTVINVQIINNGAIGADGVQQFIDEYVVPGISDAINNRDLTPIGPNSRQALMFEPA